MFADKQSKLVSIVPILFHHMRTLELVFNSTMFQSRAKCPKRQCRVQNFTLINKMIHFASTINKKAKANRLEILKSLNCTKQQVKPVLRITKYTNEQQQSEHRFVVPVLCPLLLQECRNFCDDNIANQTLQNMFR